MVHLKCCSTNICLTIIFLFLPHFTKVLYSLITVATVACQTHSRPKQKNKKTPTYWAHQSLLWSSLATANECFEYITFSYPSFLILRNQSICPNPIHPNDSSPPLRSGDNIHRLIHWTQQMRRCWVLWRCLGHIKQGAPWTISGPMPSLYTALRGTTRSGRKSAVAFRARGARVWRPDQPLTNSVKWVTLFTLPMPQPPHLWTKDNATFFARSPGTVKEKINAIV